MKIVRYHIYLTKNKQKRNEVQHESTEQMDMRRYPGAAAAL